MSFPNYSQLLRTASQAQAEISISESHALLCGLMSGSPSVNCQRWFNELFSEPSHGNVLRAEYEEVLSQIFQITHDELILNGMGFTLLLPDDDFPLNERVEALADWARGFLAGLALVGRSKDSALSEESQGFIADLAEISQAAIDEANAEEEEAFIEIEEYLRVGVMLVLDELNPAQRKPIEVDNNETPGTIDALLFPEDDKPIH